MRSHLEAKDDGPDEAEDEAVVAVDNVMGTHVLQMDPLLFEELQGLVHVLQTVDTHPTFGGFWLETKRWKWRVRAHGMIKKMGEKVLV